MNKVILFSAVVVGMLGIYVGTRLNDQTVAMLIGFFFGIIAGIPGSLLLLASMKRQTERRETQQPSTPIVMLPWQSSGQTIEQPVQPVHDLPRLQGPKQEVNRIEW